MNEAPCELVATSESRGDAVGAAVVDAPPLLVSVGVVGADADAGAEWVAEAVAVASPADGVGAIDGEGTTESVAVANDVAVVDGVDDSEECKLDELVAAAPLALCAADTDSERVEPALPEADTSPLAVEDCRNEGVMRALLLPPRPVSVGKALCIAVAEPQVEALGTPDGDFVALGLPHAVGERKGDLDAETLPVALAEALEEAENERTGADVSETRALRVRDDMGDVERELPGEREIEALLLAPREPREEAVNDGGADPETAGDALARRGLRDIRADCDAGCVASGEPLVSDEESGDTEPLARALRLEEAEVVCANV